MTHRLNVRPAGLGRAEAIVLGGLSLLVLAVVISWLGPKGTPPQASPAPATRPEVILEPLSEDKDTREVNVAPATQPEKWDFGSGNTTAANWKGFDGSNGDGRPAISNPNLTASTAPSQFDASGPILLPTD